MDPLTQNQAYVDYPYSVGLIDSYQRSQAQVIMNSLSTAIKAQNWLSANDLSNQLEAFIETASGNVDLDNMMYDSDPLQPQLTAVNNYLNRQG